MKKHIVCFGDSNTYGYCGDGLCADGGLRFNEDERWTMLLQKGLGENYLICEEGLNGRTCCFDDPLNEGLRGLDYISPCLRSHSPVDLLIVMLGTNDCKERFAATAACIGRAMGRLLKKAVDTDCWGGKKPNILLIAPPHIKEGIRQHAFWPTTGEGCVEKSRELAYYYSQQAEELACHFMDAEGLAEFNDTDCMHLTLKGHRILADELLSQIEKLI